jgi:CMP-N,N'-diacetyllegionaminic acid synthase
MNTTQKRNVAIIPARGGSKSIPKKNIMDFCGKPLIAWSIEQALTSTQVSSVYVTTDNQEIADVSKKFGAKIIERPAELATDTASSEAALVHALADIKKKEPFDAVVFLQATSPLREPSDIDSALQLFYREQAESLFSAAVLEDPCIWSDMNGEITSVTFDYKNRKRRQDRKPYFLENGSIYIFRPNTLSTYNNRLGGKISLYPMSLWKSYEIDSPDDIKICEFFMQFKRLTD